MGLENQSVKLFGNYAKRAIEIALSGFKNKRVSSSMVRDVLCCQDKNALAVFDVFMEDSISLHRAYAVGIAIYRGNTDAAIQAILKEPDISALSKMIAYLKQYRVKEIEALADTDFLERSKMIRNEILSLFEVCDRKDLMTLFLFSDDPYFANIAGRKVNE